MRALETHWKSVRWIARKLSEWGKRFASRTGLFWKPILTPLSLFQEERGGTKSPQGKHTRVPELSTHKLLQHEGGADNLGFVRPALRLGHQEHVREEEQVHVQLGACVGERGQVSWSRGKGRAGLDSCMSVHTWVCTYIGTSAHCGMLGLEGVSARSLLSLYRQGKWLT